MPKRRIFFYLDVAISISFGQKFPYMMYTYFLVFICPHVHVLG